MNNLTIAEKYLVALIALSNESDECSGIENEAGFIDVVEELELVQKLIFEQDTDRLKAKLTELLSIFKSSVVIPMEDNGQYYGGIHTGIETDFIQDMKADGTFYVWNTPIDKSCLAYDDERHYSDCNNVHILNSMITSVEKFIKEYFDRPVETNR